MTRGEIPAATFEEVINDLFQNERYTRNGLDNVYIFSKVVLTDAQKAQLSYPAGFKVADFYMISQIDQYLGGVLQNTFLSLTSILKKQQYVYGYYFTISGQSRFDPDTLTDKCKPVMLSPTATFEVNQYLEVYFNVNGTTTILGLSSDPEDIRATLQYRNCCQYFYESSSSEGIAAVEPLTCLTGLSENLDEVC